MTRRRRINKKWRAPARDLFIQCDGDIERCKAAFKEQYGSVMAILTILQILITLWELWNSKGIRTPTYTPYEGEPEWVDQDDEVE